MKEQTKAEGRYVFECRDADGNIKWSEVLDNVVCTEGKNVALDAFLAGSGYSVVGPFMGLISSVSFTATAAGDSAAQINGTNGWKEAGASNAPHYTVGGSAVRGTCAWSAASAGSKALSAGITFTATTAGTIQGAFIAFGSGAVSTIDSTAGKLWSAGAFGSAKTVAISDTVTVSYSTSL